ncbi:MAG: thermonuclease family protein [Gammaproteobacteria bacterium]
MQGALAARVIGISDGDTLTLLDARTQVKVRLANIDAPEKRQAYGAAARASLAELCFGKQASISVAARDRYGRTVATVNCEGVDANREQVRRGLAWVYDQYNKDRSLPALEQQARIARRGLWADQASQPPWEFRRKKKGAGAKKHQRRDEGWFGF